ncbi:phage head closure protein [Shimia sp.]|uniref:phage head closure protein n=1 Tax=Shimia sp. TaxID=1954381 RepID=UPI0032982A39
MNVHLSRKLTLEQSDTLPDGAGGFVESWITLGSMWADIQMRTGRERHAGEAALSLVGFKITVRGAPVGTPSRPQAGQRFREPGRIFNIEAVSERDPNGWFLTCYAKEELVV